MYMRRSHLQRLCLFAVIAFILSSSVPAQKEANFADLDRIVGNAKYVNFGEDSHFMTGVHRFVASTFKHLVETKKFRLFVFEAAWDTEAAFADFMSSERTTAAGEESIYLNAFNSKSTVEMMIWIRDWNRKNPNDKIRFTGYQPEQPVTDMKALWAVAGKSGKFSESDLQTKSKVCRAGDFKNNLEFIIATGTRRRSGQPTYTADERAACNKAIDAIESFIASNKNEIVKKSSNNHYLEAKANIKSLRTYLNTLSYSLDQSIINKDTTSAELTAQTTKLYEEGDKARFEIFEILRKTRYANLKAFFWMHNWHAMKYSAEIGAHGKEEKDVAAVPANAISMGTRMAAAYGKKMVVIGNIVPKAVCKGPRCTPQFLFRTDSHETKFASFFGAGSGLVDLRRPRKNERDLPIATSGSLYADFHQGHFTNVVLRRQFDAIYYLSETTAVFEDK